MSTIHTTTHTGPDGILKLEVPLNLPDADVDVTLIVQPRKVSRGVDREEWLRFINQAAGSIDDPSFFRHQQGEYEVRDPLP
jgi:hypothetical protein